MGGDGFRVEVGVSDTEAVVMAGIEDAGSTEVDVDAAKLGCVGVTLDSSGVGKDFVEWPE